MTVKCALLLRAVNVSGRNRVPMPELRALLEERTSLSDVSTYIASGNILCRAPGDLAAACAEVRALVAEAFGVDTPVIGRTHRELVRVLDSLPFPDASERMLHVMFLEGDPAPDAQRALEPRLHAKERIALIGRELWIDYADAAGTSKLTPGVLDRALGVAGTARNLRTVRVLAERTA